MKRAKRSVLSGIILIVLGSSLTPSVFAQVQVAILGGADLNRVVPPGFFFQGLTAPTQMRNSAAARFDASNYVIAGLVDTSGYSADVRAKYEGFLITDSPIAVNGTMLPVGAYGFGFSNDGKLNIFDLAGTSLLSVSTTKDATMKRPRPLMMTKSGNGIRLYSGRDYAVIEARYKN